MNKTIKIYIFVLVVVLAGIIYSDSNAQKPIDWRPTYSVNDKIPFGLYVLDKELKSILTNQKIERLTNTPYEFLESKFDYDTLVNNYKVKGTFLNISEYTSIDDQSVTELCYFVSHGNSLFLSMKTFPQALLDSLKLDFRSDFEFSNKTYNWMTNKNLGNQKYRLMEGMGNNYFSKIDSVNTTILGYQGNSNEKRPNFIKVAYKTGTIFLHIQPAAFTNFHLLKDNHHQYAEKVLSYIPKGAVFWYNKDQRGKAISDSPMRYILSQPALKWAWYLFLIGMLLFMIFNAKRKQRIVPIIKPLPNTTVDFTKTIGNLYYQEGDHDTIINKKIIYFLEKIRNDYLIDTHKLDDEFIKKLHHKSGKELVVIQKAIFLINAHQKSPHSSIEEDLIQINNAIEKVNC
jgi:hypothetical protein